MGIVSAGNAAANSPLMAATNVDLAPTTANQIALYGSTANTAVTNQKTGTFCITADEMSAASANGVAGPAHQRMGATPRR